MPDDNGTEPDPGTEPSGDQIDDVTVEELTAKMEEFASRVEAAEKRATEAETAREEALKKATEAEEESRQVKAKAEAEGFTLEKGTISESVAKRIAEAERRATEAEQRATVEKAARLDAEWIAKARSLDKLPIEPETFGPALRKMAEHDEETVNEIERVLKGANEQASQIAMFAEVGAAIDVVGDAGKRLEAMAKRLAEKDSITFEQAYTKVLETDTGKRLYQEERSEREVRR